MSVFLTKTEEQEYYKDKALVLHKITGVHFTNREIDIISCRLSGRTTSDEIASFLHIESKTVEAHKNNYKNKLGGKNIRDLIENSHDRDKIKSSLDSHYSRVLAQDHYFSQIIHSLKNKIKPLKIRIYYLQDQYSNYLIGDEHRKLPGKLVNYLKLIECSVDTYSVATITVTKNQLDIDDNVSNTDFVIFVLSEAFINFLNTKNYTIDEYIKLISPTLYSAGMHKIVCLKQYNGHTIKSALKNSFKQIDFYTNYYKGFLELLSVTTPSINHEIKKIIDEFDQRYGMCPPNTYDISSQKEHDIQNINLKPILIEQFFKNGIRAISKFLSTFKHIIIAICLIVIGLSLYSIYVVSDIATSTSSNLRIKSNLIVPAKTTLLSRSAILEEMSAKFNNRQTQIIALIGAGGSGKTTVARMYANAQKSHVIWEIDAETPDTIAISFEHLASTLAQTDNDKRELRWIEETRDAEIRPPFQK